LNLLEDAFQNMLFFFLDKKEQKNQVVLRATQAGECTNTNKKQSDVGNPSDRSVSASSTFSAEVGVRRLFAFVLGILCFWEVNFLTLCLWT